MAFPPKEQITDLRHLFLPDILLCDRWLWNNQIKVPYEYALSGSVLIGFDKLFEKTVQQKSPLK